MLYKYRIDTLLWSRDDVIHVCMYQKESIMYEYNKVQGSMHTAIFNQNSSDLVLKS